jgi:serine/threonine-protein kinase
MKVCPKCGQHYADSMKFCPRDGGTLEISPVPTGSGPSPDAETVIAPPSQIASSAPQTVVGENHDTLIGRVLAGRYRVLSQIGQGGMGTVYRAQHQMLGRVDAVKVIRPEVSQNPQTMQRFLREAKLASSINHPNAVVIHDFGEAENGIIYLAMEFIEGRSLDDLIRQESPVPVERAVRIAKQIAQALDAAHGLSIVHRDLKPENILVLPNDFVKVVDFGIAKSIGANETGKSVTQAGFVIGTPKYMSPEQVLGEPVDARSDIYSLALVVYELLTGMSPFAGTTPQAQMVYRVSEAPVSMNRIRPGFSLPVEIDQVVMRGLERYPSSRQQSAGVFAEELENASRKSTFIRTQESHFPRTEQFNSTGGGDVVSTGPQQTVSTRQQPLGPTTPVWATGTAPTVGATPSGSAPTLPPMAPAGNGGFQTPGAFQAPFPPVSNSQRRSRTGFVLGISAFFLLSLIGAGVGGYWFFFINPKPGAEIGKTPPEKRNTPTVRESIEKSRGLREEAKYAEALEGIESALKTAADSRELMIEKAEILFEQEKFADSEDLVYRVLKSHPDFAPAHQNLGVLKFRQNKVDEAIAAEKRCLELNPEAEYGCYAHSVLAQIYMNQFFGNRKKFANRLEEAETQARSAISLATRKSLEVSPRLMLAQIFVDRKQYALAREQTDKIFKDNALKRKRDLAGVYAQVAVIAFFEKKYGEAKSSAQKALELDPQNKDYQKLNQALDKLTNKKS